MASCQKSFLGHNSFGGRFGSHAQGEAIGCMQHCGLRALAHSRLTTGT